MKVAEKTNTDATAVPNAVAANGALASLALCMLLPALGTSIANVALPTLADAFGASFQQVQWVVLAYLLATTTLVVSVGRLGDIVGRRRLLLGGILLFTVATALCGLATQLWQLIGARAAQGLGAAVMMALTLAFVGETVPKANAGRAMGMLGTLSAVGTALGPTVGGVLISGLGWRAIFLVTVPLGLVALLLAHRHLPRDGLAASALKPGLDLWGTLLLALSLAAYALAMTVSRGQFGALNLLLLAAAALGLALFVCVELRVVSPLLQLKMFRNRVLSSGLAANALVSTVMMTTLVVGPFYLSGALGLAATQVGLALSAGPLAAALAGVPAGRWVDRFGASRVALVGLVQIATGAALLALLPATPGVAAYVGCILVMTTGYVLFQTANNTAVMADVQPERRGVTSGVLNLSRNLGFVTGASAMGALFALAAATQDITTAPPQAVASGMHTTFAVAAALVVFAVGILLANHLAARQLAPARSGRAPVLRAAKAAGPATKHS